jgi:hypothetical protein
MLHVAIMYDECHLWATFALPNWWDFAFRVPPSPPAQINGAIFSMPRHLLIESHAKHINGAIFSMPRHLGKLSKNKIHVP